MKTIKERDLELERLWEELEDVPMDPETECIEEAFHIWPAGTDREEIWHWFDERYSKGVPYLLYGDGSDCTDQIAKLTYLKQLCIECESKTCQFYYDGECRFALVCERKPVITEKDGCADYIFKENEIQASAPMEIPPVLGVGTPLGELVVRTTAGSKRLGYLINLRDPDLDTENPVVRVEVDADGSDTPNHDKGIQVHVWNSPEKTFLIRSPSYNLTRPIQGFQDPAKFQNSQTGQKRYEMFKLQWMIDHGHSLKELIHELAEYMEDCDLEMSLEDVSDEWESGRGFGSEIWPCFQEYLNSSEFTEE